MSFQHYIEDADGLCTALGEALTREGGAAYSVDKTAFEQAGWTIKREDITVSKIYIFYEKTRVFHVINFSCKKK